MPASSPDQPSTHGDRPSPGGPGWRYAVSVRGLCEYTAKEGDLDRRFTPSATATEGLLGQQTVAQRRGPDYETEWPLSGHHGPLHVRGRVDGWDPRRRCLEEVKAVRGNAADLPVNRRRLHWAQLQTYGALYCRERGVEEVSLALVYYDVVTQTEEVLHEVCGATELEAAFVARCEAFIGWARQEALHRLARDEALRGLAFPMDGFRAGQRTLAEAVYRAAAHRRCLLAQAPTGIGKTVGTLYPALRAMPLHGIDRLAYLTCKGTGRLAALEALDGLREGTAGRALRVLAMVPKEQACQHPDKACHGQSCPLAQGFYDRLPAARVQAVDEGWLDAQAQQRIALQHGVCPYYLGQELARWADVLVGDVHHLFDPRGLLWGLTQALDWSLTVLVDEAHNLVERARRMYSAELRLAGLQATLAEAPPEVAPALSRWLQAARALVAESPQPYAVLTALPDAAQQALQAAAAALGDHVQRHPLATGPLLGFHFEMQRFLRLVDGLGEHSLLEVRGGAPTDGGAYPVASELETGAPRAQADEDFEGRLGVRNVVPAPFLRPRFQGLHGVTLFSATLAPPEHAVRLLGLPEDSAWIDVPPPFPPEHLSVRVARGLSTRFADRPHSLRRLVAVMGRQFDAHPGNYLAFFSSHAYLEQAAGALGRMRPDIPNWRQDRRMAAAARDAFLGRFGPEGRGIGFAVLGGVFGEGVDLPGSRLIGAFIATLGLPPVSPELAQTRARLALLFGPEEAPGEMVPAMHRVIQAAGRVLRTPQDRGWLWLLDDRYRRPEVTALLPAWWRVS